MTVSSKSRSFSTELHGVRHAFPDSLFDVGGQRWQHLLARAAAVPASLIENSFGFEVRLGRSEPGADFCVTIKAGSKTASEFLSFPPRGKYDTLKESDETLDHDLKIEPVPHRNGGELMSLLSDIARTGSFANNAVRGGTIIFEYDVVELEHATYPSPAVFWGLTDFVSADQMEKIENMLDLVTGVATEPSHAERQRSAERQQTIKSSPLRTIAEATMPYGRISQVGNFVGRNRSDIRILVRMDHCSSIGEFLQAVGWSGNIGKATEVVSMFNFEDVKFGVALDVDADGVGPRIGLEVAAKGGWIGTRFGDWQPLVDVLVENGLCRADKANGLRKWCGYMRLFGREMCVLLKGINHFKIGIQEDEILETKAYLGACRVPAREIGLG